MRDYEKDYEDFWKDIVADFNGVVNMDQVKRELSDYKVLLENMPIVLDYATNGMCTNPLTDVDTIQSLVQDAIDDAYNEGYSDGSQHK